MTLHDLLLKFLEEHWAVVLLFLLLLMLSATHAFMIHYGRPPAIINWCEGMITGTFTAIVAKLKD